MKLFSGIVCALTLMTAADALAQGLKVELNPPDRRGDVISPHWENWPWREGHSGSQTYNGITVTFRVATNETLSPLLSKASLDYGMHMGVDGIVTKKSDGFDMVIGGLTPGEHHIATYHNDFREFTPTKFDVLVGGQSVVKDFSPSWRVTNDYEVAAA